MKGVKMKRVVLLVLFFISIGFAQIEIILDNDQAGFSINGSWNLKTSTSCYNGTARYIKRGTGANYVQWQQPILFPGEYSLDMFLINNKYAKDAHCILSTASGDSFFIVDQHYEPEGWKNLGTYEIPENFTFTISDQFADSGTYVYADAIRLTYMGSTYKIEGSVQTAQSDQRSTFTVELLLYETRKILKTFSINPGFQTFSFSDLPSNTYLLQCTAWGYDTLITDPIVVNNNDVADVILNMNPASINRHDLQGKIQLEDSLSNVKCRVELFPFGSNEFVYYDSVGNNGIFAFPNIPEAHYSLKFFADGHLSDTTTYADINLNSDVELDPLYLYAYFQIAWCSDMHIGAGYESQFQGVISNINSNRDQLDFLINSGDLTEKGLNNEYDSYNSYISACKIPVYSIAGNHDTKWSESGLQYLINNVCPLHFSFDHKGFHFIGMNSGTPMKGGSGYIDPSEITWLKQDLASLSDSTMPIVFVTHMPMELTNLVNYWKVLDLLKQYNIVFIMVGHGHVNKTYDFEGIPGAMTMDTYNSTTSGFSIVRFSKKEISVTPFLNSTDAVGTTWLRTPYKGTIQPKIDFLNLTDGAIITGTQTIQIRTESAMSSGTYSVRTASAGSGSLTGSGTSWSMEINPAELENGSHVLSVTFTDVSGNQYYRSVEFYTENGSYPKAAWRFDSKAIIISTPAFDSSNVYFGTSDGKIYGLSRNDGSPVWTPYQTNASIFSSPVVMDSTVYIGSSDGNMYAISTNTGLLQWSFNTGKAVISAVIVDDSLAYFAGNNILYAVNIYTHEKVWEYTTGGLIECKPVISGDNIIVTSWDRYVHCVNRFTGIGIWKWYKQSSFYYAPAACWPVVASDKVFVTDPAKNLTAIDLTSGAAIWESGGTPQSWESIGLSGDQSRVYVRTLDGYLSAFNTATDTKQQVWATDVEFGYDSNPSMPIEKCGTLFSGGKRGFVASLIGSTGTLNWRYWASQALVSTVTPIDGSHVLAVSLDGTITLIAGDPSEKIKTSENTVPAKNSLLSPYPNPFNNTTKIRYTLKDRQNVKVAIYDMIGREVYSIYAKNQNNGYHEINWPGVDRAGKALPSGLYIIKIETDSFQSSTKMMLLK
jgi:outer membrane protein assembly factor BamB